MKINNKINTHLLAQFTLGLNHQIDIPVRDRVGICIWRNIDNCISDIKSFIKNHIKNQNLEINHE